MGSKRAFRALPMLIVIVPLLLGSRTDPTNWTDPSAHKSGFVTANGVRLNYLDWGGSGPALILIHGMDDNPHIFDDLAPAFTDQFRVIAYAQRGQGDSEAKEPYDTATLTEDLRGLMDSLGIAKADLAGWSMAGNVVTAMAGSHPERVGRIVYLDGGYDWADPTFAPAYNSFPINLGLRAVALKSLNHFRMYESQVWLPGLKDMSRVEAYIRDLVVIQPDGSVKIRESDSTSQALLQALRTDRRDYSKVHSPALAIYAESFLDVHNTGGSQQVLNSIWEQKYMVPLRTASTERIRKELPTVEIVNVPGTHMDFVFISREQVVSAMRRFLSESAPKR
jgi:pimeloyl-ACP methyl ester carboxylesterase